MSLLRIAASASTAQSSAARSSFVRGNAPTPCEALTSTTKSTVRSRSSRYLRITGTPVRAITFQSNERTSSPGTYGRSSSNSRPRPRKTAWYSPRNRSLTSRRALISIAFTRSSNSAGMLPGPSRRNPTLEAASAEARGERRNGLRILLPRPVRGHQCLRAPGRSGRRWSTPGPPPRTSSRCGGAAHRAPVPSHRPAWCTHGH